MDRRFPRHDKMDKLMIDTVNSNILIVTGVKDLSVFHDIHDLWECVVHEYDSTSKKYSKYYSVWSTEFFDDLIEATPTTMKLYGPSELLNCSLNDLETKLRFSDFDDNHPLSMHIAGSYKI